MDFDNITCNLITEEIFFSQTDEDELELDHVDIDDEKIDVRLNL